MATRRDLRARRPIRDAELQAARSTRRAWAGGHEPHRGRGKASAGQVLKPGAISREMMHECAEKGVLARRGTDESRTCSPLPDVLEARVRPSRCCTRSGR